MGRLRQWLEKHQAAPDPDPQPNILPSRSRPRRPPRTPYFPDGVKVLHDCSDATVDICFVHGLTGDPGRTWSADGQCWPKTLLPRKLDKARILTYGGYDAYVVRKSGVTSSNRLIDHATNLLNDLTADRSNAPSRPIIFVAHSLGRLVCKQAILFSQNNPEIHLRSLFDSTIGILFMGTSHRGSWTADWAKIPASALGLFKSVNTSLLEILETENQALELIQANFWSMIRERQKANRPPEVTCFFEELPLSGVRPIVSKESATLEGYNSISKHGNHRNMAKFASTRDIGFRRVLGELVRWTSQVQAGSPYDLPVGGHPERPPNKPHNGSGSSTIFLVPQSRNPSFVGRSEILDKLKDQLSHVPTRSIGKLHPRAALYRLGGIGKTQIALAYTYQVRQSLPDVSIFWVPANTVELFN